MIGDTDIILAIDDCQY